MRLALGVREMGGGDLSEVAVLETAVDHITPEHLAAAIELLLEDGALDAFAEPLSMKKGRLGAAVSVIAVPQDAERLSQSLMRHTGTLGVRRTLTWRSVAPRRSETIETSLGTLRVKVGGSGDSLRVRPESDDVVRIAREAGLPVDVVAGRLTAEAESLLGRGRLSG
jgi:uncharacterized protein (DUF111 family)